MDVRYKGDDPYKVLGIPPNASLDAIKGAYRQLVRQYHPDIHPGDDSAEMQMKIINAAYAALTRTVSAPRDTLHDGYDVTYRARLSPSEARTGAWCAFNFSRADGQPYTLRVWISPGAWSGMRVRIPGAGGSGRRGGRSGDFYVEVQVVGDPSTQSMS